MKEYTKEYLNRKFLNSELQKNNISYNAKRAFEKLGIPEKLWLELSKEFPKSVLRQRCEANSPTTFMAGFIIGWVEKSRKIK